MFLDGLTKNWAELTLHSSDPTLEAVDWAVPRPDALSKAADLICGLPRWEILGEDRETGTLHAIHKTRVWRFVDDVYLRFEATPCGTRITGRSQSRVGKADLGQNARNLRELVRAFSARGPQSPDVR